MKKSNLFSHSADLPSEKKQAPSTNFVTVDCSFCSCNPESCDEDCVSHLDATYLEELAKRNMEEEELESENSTIVDTISDTIFCNKLSLIRKLKQDLSEEDFRFIQKDMIAHHLLVLISFPLGVLFLFLGRHFSLSLFYPLGFSILSIQLLTNLFWKGKTWNYIQKLYKRKRHPVSYNYVLKETKLLIDGKVRIPFLKRKLLLFIFIFILGISMMFL